jgi:hypothetical protein
LSAVFFISSVFLSAACFYQQRVFISSVFLSAAFFISSVFLSAACFYQQRVFISSVFLSAAFFYQLRKKIKKNAFNAFSLSTRNT